MTFSVNLTVAPGARTGLLGLPCADGDSDTAESVFSRAGPREPTFWNQTYSDSRAPPATLNVIIPAQRWENTMQVIVLRTGPTGVASAIT